MAKDIYDTFRDIGIIPVVAIEDASKAADLAHALVKGGLPASEVTFRTACAAEAIEAMIKAEPDMLVGAGTVLNVEQAEKAVKAGAKFIVSPGYNPDVVDWCIKNNVPTMPGISNPSEITACINKGVTHLKLFPAEHRLFHQRNVNRAVSRSLRFFADQTAEFHFYNTFNSNLADRVNSAALNA